MDYHRFLQQHYNRTEVWAGYCEALNVSYDQLDGLVHWGCVPPFMKPCRRRLIKSKRDAADNNPVLRALSTHNGVSLDLNQLLHLAFTEVVAKYPELIGIPADDNWTFEAWDGLEYPPLKMYQQDLPQEELETLLQGKTGFFRVLIKISIDALRQGAGTGLKFTYVFVKLHPLHPEEGKYQSDLTPDLLHKVAEAHSRHDSVYLAACWKGGDCKYLVQANLGCCVDPKLLDLSEFIDGLHTTTKDVLQEMLALRGLNTGGTCRDLRSRILVQETGVWRKYGVKNAIQLLCGRLPTGIYADRPDYMLQSPPRDGGGGERSHRQVRNNGKSAHCSDEHCQDQRAWKPNLSGSDASDPTWKPPPTAATGPNSAVNWADLPSSDSDACLSDFSGSSTDSISSNDSHSAWLKKRDLCPKYLFRDAAKDLRAEKKRGQDRTQAILTAREPGKGEFFQDSAGEHADAESGNDDFDSEDDCDAMMMGGPPSRAKRPTKLDPPAPSAASRHNSAKDFHGPLLEGMKIDQAWVQVGPGVQEVSRQGRGVRPAAAQVGFKVRTLYDLHQDCEKILRRRTQTQHAQHDPLPPASVEGKTAFLVQLGDITSGFTKVVLRRTRHLIQLAANFANRQQGDSLYRLAPSQVQAARQAGVFEFETTCQPARPGPQAKACSELTSTTFLSQQRASAAQRAAAQQHTIDSTSEDTSNDDRMEASSSHEDTAGSEPELDQQGDGRDAGGDKQRRPASPEPAVPLPQPGSGEGKGIATAVKFFKRFVMVPQVVWCLDLACLWSVTGTHPVRSCRLASKPKKQGEPAKQHECRFVCPFCDLEACQKAQPFQVLTLDQVVQAVVNSRLQHTSSAESSESPQVSSSPAVTVADVARHYGMSVDLLLRLNVHRWSKSTQADHHDKSLCQCDAENKGLMQMGTSGTWALNETHLHKEVQEDEWEANMSSNFRDNPTSQADPSESDGEGNRAEGSSFPHSPSSRGRARPAAEPTGCTYVPDVPGIDNRCNHPGHVQERLYKDLNHWLTCYRTPTVALAYAHQHALQQATAAQAVDTPPLLSESRLDDLPNQEKVFIRVMMVRPIKAVFLASVLGGGADVPDPVKEHVLCILHGQMAIVRGMLNLSQVLARRAVTIHRQFDVAPLNSVPSHTLTAVSFDACRAVQARAFQINRQDHPLQHPFPSLGCRDQHCLKHWQGLGAHSGQGRAGEANYPRRGLRDQQVAPEDRAEVYQRTRVRGH